MKITINMVIFFLICICSTLLGFAIGYESIKFFGALIAVGIPAAALAINADANNSGSKVLIDLTKE